MTDPPRVSCDSHRQGLLSSGHLLGEIPHASRSLQVAVGTLAVAAAITLACSDGPTSSSRGVSMESRQSSSPPTLTPQTSGTTQRFFAVSPVNARVVWASAAGGTFARTTNGGRTWTSGVVPGAETLQFRDVEGVSEKVAYLLSAGEGANNRIYKTEDGGRTWDLQFQAPPRHSVLLRLLRFLDPEPGHHLRRRREWPLPGHQDHRRGTLAKHRHPASSSPGW